MNGFKLICALPLLVVAAGCEVEDQGNSTVIAIDHNRVQEGVDRAANAAENAAARAENALQNAQPAIENAAENIQARAERVANRAENAADRAENAAENVDVDVNVTANNAAQRR